MTHKIVSCRSCSADIVWLKTSAGKSMPVDADTVEIGDTQFEYPRHTSHFSTCPDAKTFRKPRGTVERAGAPGVGGNRG